MRVPPAPIFVAASGAGSESECRAALRLSSQRLPTSWRCSRRNLPSLLEARSGPSSLACRSFSRTSRRLDSLIRQVGYVLECREPTNEVGVVAVLPVFQKLVKTCFVQTVDFL